MRGPASSWAPQGLSPSSCQPEKERELSHPPGKGLLSLSRPTPSTPLGLTAGEGDDKGKYGSGEKTEAWKGCWVGRGDDERQTRGKIIQSQQITEQR